MKYAFAGNREVAYNILHFLIKEGLYPSALSVLEGSLFSEKMKKLSELDNKYIYVGNDFFQENTKKALKEMDLDYIIGIHYPLIIPKEILEIPKLGFINLHPAFLPYNRGWHTPSWAILNNTKYGATLHFMSDKLDMGDIIVQKEIKISPDDTAHKLYSKVLKLEEDLFKEALPMLRSLNPIRIKQEQDKGDSHYKRDLIKEQLIELDEKVSYREAIDKFRALTTNSEEEAAYFICEGKKYTVQIEIKEVDYEQ